MKADSELILALDIGTRKVAGVVVAAKGRGFKVLAARVREHPDRAMLDGQVHRIEAVAKIVSEVKAELEADLGRPLTQAAVAAAGRALLTESAEHKRRFPQAVEITREDVLALELTAARAAQTALQAHGSKQNLHCVGFSTIRFTLDQEVLDDLVGHRGREISAEVLATFLPRQVVDSLLAVLRRAGLSARSLTLEPIAALEATIPQDLRRMNLALVDVGAGTSDIAVTRHGSVFAYAMVTQAGDEITEQLCEHYLLDFNEAERVKRALESAAGQPIAATNILSQKLNLPPEDVRQVLQPGVKKLAKAIADAIVKLNGSAPKAVVMVGGGSRTPDLGKWTAELLKLDPSRVGCRGPETIAGLENATPELHGIEAVTPLGIALLAVRGHGLNFLSVQVNQEQVQLLALQAKPAVFEALLSAGTELKALYPRPGQALTYTLSGKLMTQPGTLGEAAKIKVNGADANLDTLIAGGDRVEFRGAVAGLDARLTAGDIPKPSGPYWCTLNGIAHELELQLCDHHKSLEANASIPDRAELEWVSRQTLGEMLPELFSAPGAAPVARQIWVNGQARELARQPAAAVKVNGAAASADYRPQPNDRIEWAAGAIQPLRVRDLGISVPEPVRISVIVNGKPRTLDTGGTRILLNGQPVGLDDLLPDDSEVAIETRQGHPPILSQVLDGLDLNPPKNAGPIQLFLDGQKAAFTTPLKNGSRVDISFS